MNTDELNELSNKSPDEPFWDRAAKEFENMGKIKDLKKYVSQEDAAYIKRIKGTKHDKKLQIIKSWDEHDFYQLPHPYFGDIDNAKIIVLLTNPGDSSKEIGECSERFDDQLNLIKNANHTQIIQKDMIGFDWSVKTYQNAFWLDSDIETHIENGDFDNLISASSDVNKFFETLEEEFFLDENNCNELKEIINQAKSDEKPYKLSMLYKLIKNEPKKEIQEILIQQVRLCLINRFVASVEYYPYHSTKPAHFSFQVHNSNSDEKECLPSTRWILDRIENLVKNTAADDTKPVFIVPRKNGRERWIDTDNKIKENYCTIPVEGLKDLGNKGRIITGKAGKRSSSSTMLRPGNLYMYRDGKEFSSINMDGKSESVTPKTVMDAVLESIISDLKEKEENS